MQPHGDIHGHIAPIEHCLTRHPVNLPCTHPQDAQPESEVEKQWADAETVGGVVSMLLCIMIRP
jgi:hypothetical protein